MTHLRIRKSNTKDGYLMPGLKYGASQVVVAHDQIFVLGQTGLTLDNKGFVGEGNPAQQAATVFPAQGIPPSLQVLRQPTTTITFKDWNYSRWHEHFQQCFLA